MINSDAHSIGNKLHTIRKKKGFTQSDVAEKAHIADRTYADIERGTTSMKVDTLCKICSALSVTPNDILIDESDLSSESLEQLFLHIEKCSENDKNIILKLITTYLHLYM